MSEWITDRKPTVEDAPYGKVWITQFGVVLLADWRDVGIGETWKRMEPPQPYVKPKRWGVVYLHDTNEYCVVEYNRKPYRSYSVPTREAAERIAAIYEEVLP